MLSAFESFDDRRYGIDGAADDVVEQSTTFGVLGDRVGKAQQITVRPSVPLPVLHCLVGDLIDRRGEVPVAHRAAKTTPPPAELLNVASEQEQMRAGARHVRQCLKGCRAAGVIAQGGRGRQSK